MTSTNSILPMILSVTRVDSLEEKMPGLSDGELETVPLASHSTTVAWSCKTPSYMNFSLE